jgi:hypothetical protein
MESGSGSKRSLVPRVPKLPVGTETRYGYDSRLPQWVERPMRS